MLIAHRRKILAEIPFIGISAIELIDRQKNVPLHLLLETLFFLAKHDYIIFGESEHGRPQVAITAKGLLEIQRR